jgi:hypothetical protein
MRKNKTGYRNHDQQRVCKNIVRAKGGWRRSRSRGSIGMWWK